jgi:23S rRNA A2030 N6-methylase RlmJ
MKTYDHNEKAGNQGDVVKHTALLAAADSIISLLNGSFEYADTFAGYAFNPLKPEGEWRNGIGTFKRFASKCYNKHINYWRSLWDTKDDLIDSEYPGSSLFIQKLCISRAKHFKAQLWDISSRVVKELRISYDNQDVTIYDSSASIADFLGRAPDLLLIDPPGLKSKSKKQYPDITELIRFFNVVPNTILWFPMTAQGSGSPAPETKPSLYSRDMCLEYGLSVVSVRWSNGIRTCGCRLAYCLPNVAALALRSTVNDVATIMKWNVIHDFIMDHV